MQEQKQKLSLSYATRKVNIVPDKNRVKKHDRYVKKYNKTFMICLLITSLVCYADIRLFASGHYIWASVLALGCLVLLFYTFAIFQASSPGVYNTGLLVPAIISNTEPLEILVLANMEMSDAANEAFALQRIQVKDLPGQSISIGAKIPCIAMFGGSNGELHGHFEPRPLCWATGQETDLKNAISMIEEKEWELFRSKLPVANDLELEKEVLLNANNEIIIAESNS